MSQNYTCIAKRPARDRDPKRRNPKLLVKNSKITPLTPTPNSLKKTRKYSKYSRNTMFVVCLVFFGVFFKEFGVGAWGATFGDFFEEFQVSGFWIPVAGRAFLNTCTFSTFSELDFGVGCTALSSHPRLPVRSSLGSVTQRLHFHS